MHGLRCDPAFLGWTRLLDEWVVGLTRYNRDASTDPVCWEDQLLTLSTLTDAATRVRSFAYRDADIEPTVLLDDGTLNIELQGRAYRVACEQSWPSTPEGLNAAAVQSLDNALLRARGAARGDEIAVGTVFVTPRLMPTLSEGAPFESADSFIAASRRIPCRGCAFSFPGFDELDRYRYGNAEYPGALLLVVAADSASDVST
jgi:hypothetical protein